MQKSLSGELLTLKRTIRREFEDAEQARIEGNEGRARVCARRAAGWAVSFTRSLNEEREIEANAYEMLQWLAQQADTAEPIRAAAARLTTRVSLDHTLPFPEDPLEDARTIVEALLGTNWAETVEAKDSGDST